VSDSGVIAAQRAAPSSEEPEQGISGGARLNYRVFHRGIQAVEKNRGRSMALLSIAGSWKAA